VASHTDRIVGGKNAGENSAPFIVTIQFYPLTRAEGLPIHVCGGAVISDSWVTTAAHCIIGLLPDEIDVYAGVYDLSDTDNGNVQKRNVEKLILHPYYVGDVAPYDLGLIRVTQPFDFNDNVQPINLPVKDRIHNGMVYVFGWGDGLDPSKFNDRLQV
jgi:secreted trypsin-like serine protease